jgi:O-acetyl-ADP-ribose deacetylase (regulator of RNase III)
MIKIGGLEGAVERAIAHQVNDQGKMGSGVAKALYTRYPEVKKKYLDLFNNKFHESYLGKIQPVETQGKVIYNVFSQRGYGYDGKQYTNYPFLSFCLNSILMDINERGIDKIAFPWKYGCGLGGGDWEKVKPMIQEVFGERVIFYSLEK